MKRLAGQILGWFALTRREQGAVLLVLGLLLLGLVGRAWHARQATLLEPVSPAADTRAQD